MVGFLRENIANIARSYYSTGTRSVLLAMPGVPMAITKPSLVRLLGRYLRKIDPADYADTNGPCRQSGLIMSESCYLLLLFLPPRGDGSESQEIQPQPSRACIIISSHVYSYSRVRTGQVQAQSCKELNHQTQPSRSGMSPANMLKRQKHHASELISQKSIAWRDANPRMTAANLL